MSKDEKPTIHARGPDVPHGLGLDILGTVGVLPCLGKDCGTFTSRRASLSFGPLYALNSKLQTLKPLSPTVSGLDFGPPSHKL